MTAEVLDEFDPFALPSPPEPDAVAATGACSLRGGVLRVDGLAVMDPDTVAGARRALAAGGPSGLDAWARSAVAVGARAISTAGATAGLDDLADRLGRLADGAAEVAERSAEQVRAAVERAADPDRGTVAVSVHAAMTGLAASVDEMLAGEDAPLRQSVSRAVRAATDDAALRVERALAASTAQVRQALTDPGGPIAAMRAEQARHSDALRADLGGQLVQVRELLAAAGAADAVMARTAVKGAGFEEAAVAAVVDCAAPGDLVEATGTSAGATGGRHGDAVVHVDAAAARGLAGVRVAVECKDRTGLSPAALARAMDDAAANRQAQAAVAVVRRARMPGTAGVLVLSLAPARIAVGHEPGGDPALLRAALHLARAAAVEQALADAAPGTDTAALGAAVRAAGDALDEWSRVDRAIAATRRAVDETARAADHVRARVGSALAAASRLLGPGTAP